MELRNELHWNRIVTCYADRPASLWGWISGIMADRADIVAVVDGEHCVSYGELDRQSAGIAALLSGIGVGPGDRVAAILDNGADAVRTVLAVMRLGAVIVPVGTRSRTPELAYIFTDAEPVAVIHDPRFAAELPDAKSFPLVRIDVTSASWLGALQSSDASPPAPETDEEALFGILYTSGTTGRPKGAMLTRFNVVHSCLHWIDRFGLGADDRTLFCVPWAHVSGLCGVMLPFLYLGGTQVMVREFKAGPVVALAAAERITHALMVPAMYGLFLLDPDLAVYDLGAWRIAAYGGAPMPEPTITRFAEVFPLLAMCNAYGATETTSPTTIMPPGEGTKRSDSIGTVVRCGSVLVVDEAGREVPPGVDGEYWIGGPMVIPGYWRNPEATAASFAGGYWKSGDIGSIDAEGFVRIADRKKDMVIRGGFKVYPAEVESVLTGIPGVIEAAVVGRADDILGEGVVAFVCAGDSGPDEAAVRAYCATRLSDYKVPGAVVIGTEPLPRNANGKIQKAELRERAARLPQPVRVS